MNEGSRGVRDNLPDEFECSHYLAANPDLQGFTCDEALLHYQVHGIEEGRIANSLKDRQDFANLARDVKSLELAPFARPLLAGANVHYADIMTEEGLRARAVAVGMDPEGVPSINWVVAAGNLLTAIPERYQYVLSSHLVEHTPDLVSHLRDVSALLTAGGRYFVLIPDHRYCFDALLSPTPLSRIVASHVLRATRHSLASVIEHRALTVHNDAARHWLGDHGADDGRLRERVTAAVSEYVTANGAYIDVHAWQFTPRSWREIIESLFLMQLVDFAIERVYPTRYGSNEFWCVLRKSSPETFTRAPGRAP